MLMSKKMVFFQKLTTSIKMTLNLISAIKLITSLIILTLDLLQFFQHLLQM